MNGTVFQARPEQSISDDDVERLVRELCVPPRPQILTELAAEMARDEPDPRRIARIVTTDVALSAAVLRIANAPGYSMGRQPSTLEQAIGLLGLKQLGAIVTRLVMQKVLRTNGPQLTRFWDVSAKRSWALTQLARRLGGVDVDVAQTFGLFCDVGIPLLAQRHANYVETLKLCNAELVRSFTEVEQAVHHADHAQIGAIMARSWGVAPDIVTAIRRHHDYTVFLDAKAPAATVSLIAQSLVAELAIQRFAGLNSSTEWDKGGDRAMGALVLGETDLNDWIDLLVEGFARGDA